MTLWVLLLIPAGAAVSWAVCGIVLVLSHRAGAFDSEPAPGQAKMPRRRIPNTGGIGLFAGVAGPMAAGLVAIGLAPADAGWLPAGLAVHLPGARGELPLGGLLLACLAWTHALGLIDDRRPLAPLLKLALLAVPAVALATLGGTRLLELLDPLAGGAWLSVLVTAAWFLAVTNAMNFMDNMDGLSAGVTAIAAACIMAAALLGGQWFVAGLLALLVGSCAGFLAWNFPPARLFMGDGGSLVLGLLLAFLTVRTTYAGAAPTGEPLRAAWYAVFMPLVVLAVPLYDMVSVVTMRLRQGRSPMVGDLQHLSHRLVKRGVGRRTAVLLVWGFTAITGISGVALGSLAPWQAVLVAVQTALILGVLAALEFATSPAGARHDSLEIARPGAAEAGRG